MRKANIVDYLPWLVLAVLVLLVLAYFFTGGFGKGQRAIFACEDKGGICQSEAVCRAEGKTVQKLFKCESEGTVCCMG